MKMLLKTILGLLLILSFTSCDKIIKKVCGDPAGLRKEFIDSLNNSNKGILEATEVPCYPSYFRIDLKSEPDSIELINLETLIKKHNYREILVYDKNRMLIRGETGSM